jgi:hypothetical protein
MLGFGATSQLEALDLGVQPRLGRGAQSAFVVGALLLDQRALALGREPRTLRRLSLFSSLFRREPAQLRERVQAGAFSCFRHLHRLTRGRARRLGALK